MKTAAFFLVCAVSTGCVPLADDGDEFMEESEELIGESAQSLSGDSNSFLHPMMRWSENRQFSCTFWGPASGTETRTINFALWDDPQAIIWMAVQGNGYSFDERWELSSPAIQVSDCSSTAHTRWNLESYIGSSTQPITCKADARRLPGEPDRLNISNCSNGYAMECIRIAGKNQPYCDSAACNFASCGTGVGYVYDWVDGTFTNPEKEPELPVPYTEQ